MAVRRPGPQAADVPVSQGGVDPAWALRWPDLCAHLFDLRYDDGSPRQTSTLMILAELGVVKVCLNDREAGRSAWVSGRTVDEALEALQVGISADSLDWRARQPGRWDKKRGK